MLEACVSYGFLCEPFWLKLGSKDPGRLHVFEDNCAVTQNRQLAGHCFQWVFPGGPRAPFIYFLHGPAYCVSKWSSILNRLLWALSVPFYVAYLISISKPSGVPRGTPSPHFCSEPQLAPQLGFLGVGYLLFPLPLIIPVPARGQA